MGIFPPPREFIATAQTMNPDTDSNPTPRKSDSPRRNISRADMQWLRWAIVCITVLSIQVLMQFGGQFDALQALLGAAVGADTPGAETGVLSPAATFLISIPLTMYGTAVLLSSNSFVKSLGITALACIALSLPAAIAALWGVSLHTLPLVCCVLIMPVLTGFIFLIDKKHA